MANNYIILEGYGRTVKVNYVWRRTKDAMDKAFSRMVGEEPNEDNEGAYGWMMKERGKDNFYVAVSGAGHSLLDTIIHECAHVGQTASKNREVAAELTARLASALIYELRKKKGAKLFERI